MIAKKIFQKLTSKKKTMPTDAKKKRRKLSLKKLTPEQKKKALEAYKKISGAIIKYGETGIKPKISVEPKVNVKFDKDSFKDYWNMPVNLGFMSPTRKQLGIAAGTAILIGVIASKKRRKKIIN